MNPASMDIKTLLAEESSLGLTFAENLFIGKEPPIPDDCVTIFDTPGFSPDMPLKGQQEDGKLYCSPSVQIRVRDLDYVVGWTLVNDIKIFLHGINNIMINGVQYHSILCSGEPFFLNWDTGDRALFVVNFNIFREGR